MLLVLALAVIAVAVAGTMAMAAVPVRDLGHLRVREKLHEEEDEQVEALLVDLVHVERLGRHVGVLAALVAPAGKAAAAAAAAAEGPSPRAAYAAYLGCGSVLS